MMAFMPRQRNTVPTSAMSFQSTEAGKMAELVAKIFGVEFETSIVVLLQDQRLKE